MRMDMQEGDSELADFGEAAFMSVGFVDGYHDHGRYPAFSAFKNCHPPVDTRNPFGVMYSSSGKSVQDVCGVLLHRSTIATASKS